jgi:muramoyltetrapeptide carboxypeptidase
VTIRPPRIKRGETLGIVAPAGPIKLDKLHMGLARLGDAFRLRLADSLTAPREDNIPSYLAASDETRVRELNAMLADRDVRAILLARGGYGLMRILPRLDAEALRRDPKPIIGFSDATALLAWAHAAGVRGIHGPMGVQMGVLADSDIAHLISLMSDAHVPGVRPWRLASHGRGKHRGPLITANLTLLSMLVGTPYELPVARSITLIEEVGEKPYELDRYLSQLALTGQLAKMNAMIVGDLTRCADANPPTGVPDPEDAALQTVLERVRPLPVAVGAPIGHGNQNEAVPFGAEAILDLDAGTLEITEAAVD